MGEEGGRRERRVVWRELRMRRREERDEVSWPILGVMSRLVLKQRVR